MPLSYWIIAIGTVFVVLVVVLAVTWFALYSVSRAADEEEEELQKRMEEGVM